ncbi:MAG: bifunctional enoyl-CoA hydratase/phosphate acetyltransferase [Dokdonella sp.]|uniref:bifunctional enoyl-CoA hydratase/phosphate acetyltransferase n=1 Tax=Dokdonella sp. TaxID=2291710 RepID=UPI0025C301FF|nr:bifunctional enoyl-CoA hydratase/phosphate acetyltransferase [Dokdonella sp.]MBZ0222473.1 bifunctional enoyl-CoA hydratase/phosphate acetyltransferase [Dokdonella sp.]MCC7256566.1 bifunctional enoyl-CoA hydratase/phosphate acetyltransferase [Dokdonella sp.]
MSRPSAPVHTHARGLLEEHAHGGYERLLRAAQTLPAIRVAVAHPCHVEALKAVIVARDEGLIVPVLVGPRARIDVLAAQGGIDLAGIERVDTEHSHASADAAVLLARQGKVAAVMKGSLHTDELLHAVLDRDNGLRTARRLSHAFLMDVPRYPRPLLITDAAVNIAPTLAEKADILQNAIDLMRKLGYEAPRVAILSAVETVNPAIPSTIEAAALCKMVDRGQISGGIVDGPLAFDNAVSEEAARIKGIASPVAGRADVLLVPDLEAGNMLYKQLVYLADADAAGVVLGARVPIILTSRADSLRIHLASCALAVVLAALPAEPTT